MYKAHGSPGLIWKRATVDVLEEPGEKHYLERHQVGLQPPKLPSWRVAAGQGSREGGPGTSPFLPFPTAGTELCQPRLLHGLSPSSSLGQGFLPCPSYWFFWLTDILHTLLLLFKEKQLNKSDIQKCKFLISRTRTTSILPISAKIENYLLYLPLCEAGEEIKKK